MSWIESVREVMEIYTERTDGSYIERGDSYIMWNFVETDVELGNWQVKDLVCQLDAVFQSLPLDRILGNGYLIVKLKKISKKKIVKNLLKRVIPKGMVNFILFVGEEYGNEDTFKYLNTKEFLKDSPIDSNVSVYC